MCLFVCLLAGDVICLFSRGGSGGIGTAQSTTNLFGIKYGHVVEMDYYVYHIVKYEL